MAINRDALLKRVTPEGGLWPNMPINGGFGKSWWLDPQGSEIGDAGANYKYNVTEAKALLSAAGFADGFEVPMHFASTVYSTVVPYYPIVKDGLTALFAQVGIKVKEVPEEYGTYIGTTFAGQFDGMAFSLESVFSDIAAYWQNMFNSKESGAGRNHSSVNDTELQANIKKMLAAQSLDEIQKQNFELQKYTSSKMYYVPVVTPVEFAARAPKLKGVLNTHRADNVRGRHRGRAEELALRLALAEPNNELTRGGRFSYGRRALRGVTHAAIHLQTPATRDPDAHRRFDDRLLHAARPPRRPRAASRRR